MSHRIRKQDQHSQPEATQKRLGDGFYEQQLIREQVAALTGFRFLGDYRSDEAQYMALMNAGATFARAQQLRPGIALSPAQVTQLTSDMVWLVAQTVTLPDGSTTTALVPQVYLAPKSGDLANNGQLFGGGAVISANEVRMALSGDVNNSGTIMGRKLVDISAQNISNSGLIQGDKALLSAREDINITGGQVRGTSAAVATAGGNLNITTTTQSSQNTAGGNSFSHSGIDRVAGIYVSGPAGVLLASAGGDINLTAAQLHNAGSGLTQISAGGDVNLKTVDVGSSQNITWSANNYLRQSSSTEVGTQVSGGGAVNIEADNNVAMRAADVNAKGALNVNAGGNVLIEAGENTESLAEGRQSTSRGTFSSKTTTTRSSSESTTAQASELGGQSVSVTGQNVVSVGTRFESTDGALHIEGADKTLLYATQDSQKSESSSDTKSTFLGLTTGKSESTSSSERSTAVRTELISDEAVRIGVGERTELVGARVQAPQIDFVRSQNAAPDAAGELHLGAATETDKASEKSTTTTLGVWQKQEGSGHERHTAQMTELLGAVQIAPDIALSVQLPREVNTHNPSPAPSLQTQVQQLASANPGLAYLAQLQANPAVKWSELELAQREWSYSQQGLTGAGAALVALAVAWATGGMGVELLGSTTTTATGTVTTLGGTTLATTTAATATTAATTTTFAAGAALNAGFAGLAATASVSLINNGGDIGKTLRELGSKDSLKSLLLSMATAGALNGLSNSLTINGQTLASITPQTADFGANLAKAAINNVASAAINSALTGASLEDSIQTALVGALVSTAAGQTANWIGDVTADSPALKALAHALAGCVAGAAGQGGGAGCSAGAAGAVVGELAAQWYNPSGDPSKSANTVAFAGLMGGLAGALATGDGSAASVNTAATTGANAALNNYLAHTQQRRFAEELNACKTEAACQAVLEKYQRISDANNTALAKAQAQCVSTGDCAERDRLFASGVAWGQGLKNDSVGTDPESAMLQPVLANANAQSVKDLINRPLSQEVLRLNSAYSYDAAGNVQIDPARYVAAIDNRNAQTAMAAAMAPTLLLPGPEDLAVGAALATNAGQKIAEVVIVNGLKVWKFSDGATARVGSREAEALARARMENNANADNARDPLNIQSPENTAASTNLAAKKTADQAAGTYNPHYDTKHGPYTSNEQQYQRAMNGIDPITGQATRSKPDASKFFNTADMELAIQKAEAQYAANPAAYDPEKGIPIPFPRPVGNGYIGNNPDNIRAGLTPGEHRWTNTATVRIDLKTGKAYTAYPNLQNGGYTVPDPRK